MLYGLVRAARDWRRWSLLYLFVAVYTLIHLLSWALVRYRLPVDAVLIVFAGVAVQGLLERMRMWCTRGVTLRCEHADSNLIHFADSN